MSRRKKEGFWDNFRRFFVRGLAIVLPSVLTIWILIAAYSFVQTKIAEPINRGMRECVIRFSDWPAVPEVEVAARKLRYDEGKVADEELARKYERAEDKRAYVARELRRRALVDRWNAYRFPLDLIGLAVAVVLIYTAGGVLGSFLGRRIYRAAEELVGRLPLINKVYPSVKQVTEFLVGGAHDDEAGAKPKFNRVVAVQYPRKGLWSVGLVTGDTLRKIQDEAQAECVTVFIPSSPTPFTGYVVTVPVTDTIDLPVTIEEALRFTVSGGVLVPPGQKIAPRAVAEKLPAPPADPNRTDPINLENPDGN